MARRGESGSTHTLEAFVMLTFMFVAVVSVTDFTTNDTSAARIERILTTKAKDVVSAWSEMEYFPTDVCAPESRLDELVFDGLKEDHALWEKVVENNFGPAFDVDLVIDNYESIYPLHGSGRVVGNTGIVDWTRDDTYVKPLSAVNTVSGTERVRIDAPAIHYGVLAKAKGEAVRYGVNYTAIAGEGGHRTAWGNTAMLTKSVENQDRDAAAAVHWSSLLEKPLLAQRLAEGQIASAETIPVPLFLHVGPAGSQPGTPIAAGTIINVSFPAGWRDASWYAETLAPWVDRSPPQEIGKPPLLVAEAGEGASAKALQLQAFAPTDGARPYDVISARLSRGSLAESNLVVTYPIPDTDRSTPRVLAPTTPYGMRAGNSFVFGAALANGGDPIKVTDFTIEIPGGYDLARHNGDGAPLFAGIVTEAGTSRPASGWERIDARHVRWTAASAADEVPIDALHAADFFVTIQLSSDPRHGTSNESSRYDGPNVTLEFENGHKVTSRSWGKSPGVASFLVDPATLAEEDPSGGSDDGYPWSASALAIGKPRHYDASSRSAVANIERETSYVLRPGAADAVNLENGASNASFEVKTRKVPVGSRVRADGDLSSLLATLNQLGFESELTLELYSPPSLGCTPTASWEIETAHLPTAGISHTLLWDAGEPTSSVFVTTADNYLYRIDATGSPVWATKLSAKPTSLEKMDLGAGGKYLLVASTGGGVEAVEALEGETLWIRELGGIAIGAPPLALHDAERGIVVASAPGVIAKMAPTTGDIILSVDPATDVLDIIPTPQGFYLRSTAGYRLLDATDLQPIETNGGILTGLAANEDLVIVSDSTSARAIDARTGAAVGAPVIFPREAVKTARGMATLDNVEDLVVGLADHSVYAIDGATGALAWSGAPAAAGEPTPSPDFWAEGDLGPPPVEFCSPSAWPPTYTSQYVCSEDAASDVKVLVAGGARSALAKSTGGSSAAIAVRSGTHTEWDDLRSDGAPTALDIGPWLANSRALAYGNENGKLVIYDDNGLEVLASEPSERAGKFSFYMVVPEGGFYGTHLLVARLAWTDGVQHQEARLLDWFEVVSKSGEPVPRPAYRIALSVAQREAPLS